MKTLIVDYGMGNLLSVKNAFERCGTETIVSDNPLDYTDEIDNMVLPGVGAFNDGMKNLQKSGWIPIIHEAAIQDQVPLLGICLGMQLLADKSFEMEETSGLGLIPGDVIKLDNTLTQDKIPHVGWNEINIINDSPLFKSVNDGVDFYFVHSYQFVPKNEKNIIAKTPYCGGFVSSVGEKNILGVQFHPEKSQKPGLKLISNFLKMGVEDFC